MTVHEFPKRLTALPMEQQRDVLRSATMGEVLAAFVAKYPNLTLTADEIQKWRGWTVRVVPRRGEWGFQLVEREQQR